jgi:REP element-mobilizing transposase RayT
MKDMFDDNAIHCEMYVHLAWSTKNQESILLPLASYLYNYLCEVALSLDCHIIEGKIFSDHVQLVTKYSPEISLSNLITSLKVASSLLIRTNFPELKDFEWQKSDFLFSVSPEEVCSTINSKAKLFREEVCILLENNRLEYNLQDVLE